MPHLVPPTKRRSPTTRAVSFLAAAIGAAAIVGIAFAAEPRAEEVVFRSGELSLAGTLTWPEASGPVPAVVLIAGSGPQNRDSELAGIPGYRPFVELAARLAEHGVAVLRFDERGVGASEGDNATADSADLAADVEAALDHLRGREGVDPNRVGLLGHSEGGMIAAMIAARDPGVAFVIALAPPVADALEGLVLQERRMLEAAGAPPEVVEAQVAMTRTSLELTLAEDWVALEDLLQETVRTQLAAMPEAQRAGLGDPDVVRESLVAQTMVQFRNWMHSFLAHDAQADWQRVDVPALVVFGGRDTQVDEAMHRAALEDVVEDGQVTVAVLPDANHLFQNAVTGSPSEYAQLAPELAPDLLSTVIEWVEVHVLDRAN